MLPLYPTTLKTGPTLPIFMARFPKRTRSSFNSFYGFQMAGIYQNQKEIDAYLTGAPHADIKPGDIKFEDLNGDGIINDNDRTYIGNPNPRFTYGGNVSASYMGFDLSVLVQGVSGVEKYNNHKKIIDYDTRPFNHSVSTLNACMAREPAIRCRVPLSQIMAAVKSPAFS